MNLKICPVLFVLFLLGFSCSKQKETTGGQAKKSEQQAKNHFIINSLGDTIPTGVSIPVKGKRINFDSVAQSKVIPSPWTPQVAQAHQNVYPAGEPKVVHIPSQLKKIAPGENGMPLPDTLRGHTIVLPAQYSEPIVAQPFQMRANSVRNIQYFGIEEGLSDYYVYSILVDKRGNLWVGCGFGMLNRLDGKNLTYFPSPESLPEHRHILHSLLEDEMGNIWFGTQTGLGRYDGNQVTYFSNENGPQYLGVEVLIQDQQGHIWFGTNNYGIARFNPKVEGGSFIHYTTEEGLINNSVKTILKDSQGILWVGTVEGVSRFDGKVFTSFTTKEGLSHNMINAIVEDSKGNIWLGSEGGGLSRYDKTSFAHYSSEEGLQGNKVRSILEDRRGNLWLGMYGWTMNRFDGSSFTNYQEENGMNSSHVYCMMEDEHGNIWAGSGSGLHRIGAFDWAHYYDLMTSFDIPGVDEDHDGNIWFGTRGGTDPVAGLIKFDEERFTLITQEKGLGPNMEGMNTISIDRQGTIWLGGSVSGVAQYDGHTLKQFAQEDGLINHLINAIHEDNRGNLWFGTEEGLEVFDGKNFIQFTEREGLISNAIFSLRADHKNDLWFGSRNSLGRFDGTALTFFTKKEGLPNNWISSIFEDSNKNLWIGTEDGLSLLNLAGNDVAEGFTNFTKENGLIDNRIRSIIEDKERNIWVGTQNGLSLFVPTAEEVTNGDLNPKPPYKIFNFDKADGLKQTGFHRNSVCLDSKNRLWWGKENGAMMLELDHFKLPTQPPSLHLDRIAFADQYVDFRRLSDTTYSKTLSFGNVLRHSFDSVASFFNYPHNLKLPYDLNHLTFHFSGIDWAGPDRVKYSYWIKGLDKDWSIPRSASKAEYRNLPHGKHTLQVKSIGAAQVWCEPVEYTFIIHPPWWFTWWAYTLYALAALLLLTGLFLYQRRRWQLQTRLEVEEEKANRLKELDQFKSRFYTNITHEFRTPLTVIKGIANQINGQEKIKTLIQRNSNRLLNLVNQLLDLSKLETKSLSIDWVQGDVIPYLQYLTESCHSLAGSKNINLAFFSKVESLEMDFDENKLQQILINLLSNAIKFTPEYGSVKVIAAQVIENGDPFLELTVRDTGKGIPQEKLANIFNRFYQVDDTATRQGEGSGIGLALVKELVHLLSGRIGVESEVGKGSSFLVYIPIHLEAPKDLGVEQSTPGVPLIDETGVVNHAILTPAVANGENPLVLIIEDNADVTEYIISCLAADYNLQTAPNGKIGVEKALEIIPDVILSDVMMPEMDGFEVCQYLKTDRRTSHIPIVLLTAKATQEDKVAGLSHGADAYLTKPFDKEELLIRLSNLAAQSKRLRERLTDSAGHNDPANELETREAAFLQELNQSISSNLGNELFDTNHLCRAIAMSRAQLHRKLKALTGQATANYIRTFRLHQAKTLLETTDTPIGEIALQVGFKDFSHFSRSFLKEFGVKPSDIRK